MVIDIPVANGNTIKSFTKLMLQIFFKQCKVIALVILTIRLDPIALGCKALTSPLRPMP
jgi:hypothetical protein